jgi:hypothetical protein
MGSAKECLIQASRSIGAITDEQVSVVVSTLWDLVFFVNHLYSLEPSDTKRSSIRAELEELRGYTAALVRQLTTPAIVRVLHGASDPQRLAAEVSELQIVPHLNALSRRAKQALERLPLERAGTGGVNQLLGLTVQQGTALSILVLWETIHGRQPGLKNKKAAEAATYLLQVATAPSEDRDPPARVVDAGAWRRHFKAVAAAKKSPAIVTIGTAESGAAEISGDMLIAARNQITEILASHKDQLLQASLQPKRVARS